MLATPLETATLPPGIRSRFVRGVNGLDIHILEAGYAPAGRPLVLLLHGFPEIAYSWRKVMPALAEAGFHAVAPGQRGYGRTTGWSPDFDTDLRPWRTLNAVRRRARPRGVGAPFDPRRRRQRFRCRDRRVVCAGSARRVPLAGAGDGV